MYENFSKPKGLCLILNNRDFTTASVRYGTDVDADNIDLLFTRLGYKTEIKKNLTATVSEIALVMHEILSSMIHRRWHKR